MYFENMEKKSDVRNKIRLEFYYIEVNNAKVNEKKNSEKQKSRCSTKVQFHQLGATREL